MRPKEELIAITTEKIVAEQLSLVYGVKPVHIRKIPEHGRVFNCTIYLLKKKMLRRDDFVLYTAGVYTNKEHVSNLIETHKIMDMLNYAKKLKSHGNYGY